MGSLLVHMSYKDMCILKHSLRNRIATDADNYNKLVIKRNNSKLTASEDKFIKEHEEHVKCLKRITESVFMIQKKLNIKRSGVSDNIRKGN